MDNPISPRLSHAQHLAHTAAIRSIQRVVAETAPAQDPAAAFAGIRRILAEHRPLIVTGAGVSTASGIPDYRGPRGSLRRHRPMTYQEFRYDDGARQRYWARSYIGWRRIARADPNPAHTILASWVRRGVAAGLVTQNVDGLHQAAGTPGVVALHGDLETVVCLDCGARETRASLDDRLRALNPAFAERAAVDESLINPDGDVALPEDLVADFVLAPCLACGSLALKPDVVYFGENVPAARKARAAELLRGAGSLLAIGTSLAVTSGYKLVLDARAADKPVGIINGGPSRGDPKAQHRWRTDVVEALQRLDADL